jgi:hypothetical protein
MVGSSATGRLILHGGMEKDFRVKAQARPFEYKMGAGGPDDSLAEVSPYPPYNPHRRNSSVNRSISLACQ